MDYRRDFVSELLLLYETPKVKPQKWEKLSGKRTIIHLSSGEGLSEATEGAIPEALQVKGQGSFGFFPKLPCFYWKVSSWF
jgi:hypothetical protein